MSFNSKVMCTRLFGIRHLEIRMSLDMSRDQFYALVGLFYSSIVWPTVLSKDNVFETSFSDFMAE